MRLVLVAAIAEDRGIGRDGALPWRLPDDLKRFKALTLGKPVIMGRKTFDSIGRPLPGRRNVVLTRTPRPIEGCVVVGSAEEALAACDAAPEACVIGGGDVYAAFLDRADEGIHLGLGALGLQPHPAVGQILHVARHLVLLRDLPRGEAEADALHMAAENDGGVVDLRHHQAPYAAARRVQPPISPDF